MHLYADPGYATTVGGNFNEATTQYFVNETGMTPFFTSVRVYTDGVTELRKQLPTLGGQDVIKQAYFGGSFEAMRAAYKDPRGRTHIKLEDHIRNFAF